MTTVLVIEDEADIRLLARLILERADCEVIEAIDGREGLALIERIDPDLVLLDLRMADMDGWAVLAELQRAGRLPGLPVVVVSAHAEPDVFEAVLAIGCRGYLRKPFQRDELLATLRYARSNGH